MFSFAGRFFHRKRDFDPDLIPVLKIAILVPAYREDGIIQSTVSSLLQSDYPRHLFDIFIIADSFKAETIAELRRSPVHVMEVSFEKSTKTRSLNAAFNRIQEDYHVALISDADNMLAKDFLKRINSSFVNGYKAVQGRRVAKNLDTPFAILDACSEAINNHIFRKGANALGLSSSVIGSGMAFEFLTIKRILGEIDAVGGFDKILQLKIVKKGIRIEYLEDALVFDEKVDSSQAFEHQRKRWISSQFIYLKRFFGPAFQQLAKGNLSYFNLSLVSNLVLPRAFLLLLLPLLVISGFLITQTIGWIAGGMLLLYLISLGMGVPVQMINRDLFAALLRLPRAIFLMVLSLLQVRKANKTFIHTVHTKTEVKNRMFSDSSK